MTKYRFSLQKTLWQSRRGKLVEKVTFVDAPDISTAYKIIEILYSCWDVSMFWPVV